MRPRVDDGAVPLTDALVAGCVAPTLATFGWLAVGALGAPRPTWLALAGRGRGGLLQPVLVHGCALTACWIGGALSAEAYTEERYLGDAALPTTLRAGAFASGLLIVATQLRLAASFGVDPLEVLAAPDLAAPSAMDLAKGQAAVEIAVDIFVEASALLFWRLQRAKEPPRRPPASW